MTAKETYDLEKHVVKQSIIRKEYFIDCNQSLQGLQGIYSLRTSIVIINLLSHIESETTIIIHKYGAMNDLLIL
jgi:hypothetical protein